jgi:glyceraldehyde 3-phosphate dehydrogenase
MTIPLGINGFGRMGRLGLRIALARQLPLHFYKINDVATSAQAAAHLLQFDSVHGRFAVDAEGEGGVLQLGEQTLAYSQTAKIEDTDWSGCAIVLECSGKFKTLEQLAPYFAQGVKKVIVAAPVKGALNIVMGINDSLYNPSENHIVTAASCTTNCLAPLVKVMHENIGIRHGSITTLHNITNTQSIVDKGHKDLRRARACGESLIPTTTGSAKAIGEIFPQLNGRLNGHAVRVPLLNASLTDFVFEAERATTVEEVNGFFAAAAVGALSGILAYETRPLVSVDFKDDPHSAIVDALSTMVINGTQVKVYAWYDNEWGYMNRMMELAVKVANSLEV